MERLIILYDLILNPVHEMTKDDQNSFIIQSQGIWGYSENLVYRILGFICYRLSRRGTKYVNVKAIDLSFI